MSSAPAQHILKTPFARFILNLESVFKFSPVKDQFNEKYVEAIAMRMPGIETRFVKLSSALFFLSFAQVLILNGISIPITDLLNLKIPLSPGIKEIILLLASNIFLAYTMTLINYMGHTQVIKQYCFANFGPIDAEIFELKLWSSGIVSNIAKVHWAGYRSSTANKVYAALFVAFLASLIFSVPIFAVCVQAFVIYAILCGETSWGAMSTVVAYYAAIVITLSVALFFFTFFVPFRFAVPTRTE